jgi:hypothetical protein
MVREAEQALRALQKLDEIVSLGTHRYLLIEAETALGELLGLECTGEVDGTNADGTPAFYSHNGSTCPIHEWLIEQDGRDIHELMREGEVR